MTRWMSLALALALLVGAGMTLTACQSTQDGATPSQFDKPFDGSIFKGRRE
jgi:hypothetical protein